MQPSSMSEAEGGWQLHHNLAKSQVSDGRRQAAIVIQSWQSYKFARTEGGRQAGRQAGSYSSGGEELG